MSYHDEVFRENDCENYKSVRQLQLWLLTMGHLSFETTELVLSALESFCSEMKWPLVDDETLGRKLLK